LCGIALVDFTLFDGKNLQIVSAFFGEIIDKGKKMRIANAIRRTGFGIKI